MSPYRALLARPVRAAWRSPAASAGCRSAATAWPSCSPCTPPPAPSRPRARRSRRSPRAPACSRPCGGGSSTPAGRGRWPGSRRCTPRAGAAGPRLRARLDAAALVVVAGVAGATCPPLIATARSVWPAVAGRSSPRPRTPSTPRWATRRRSPARRRVGLLAGLVSPTFALAAVIPGPAIGALLVARPGRLRAPATPRIRRPRAVMPAPDVALHRVFGALRESAGLRTLAFCDMALGLGWGALDVALPATAARPARRRWRRCRSR